MMSNEGPPTPPQSIKGEFQPRMHLISGRQTTLDPEDQPPLSHGNQETFPAYQSPTLESQPLFYDQGLLPQHHRVRSLTPEIRSQTGHFSPYSLEAKPNELVQLDQTFNDFDSPVSGMSENHEQQPHFLFYEQQDNMSYGSRSSVPLTPTSSDYSQEPHRTVPPARRGATPQMTRAIAQGKTKVTRRAKKVNRRGEAKRTPQLTAPLSILTKDFVDIAVRDMDAWVNRSVEKRIKEVEDRKGYITRPMNSFMLYRSAYAERTKAWCTQNNHQVVSSVSGESWPLETLEIRNKYNDLAKLERLNHQKAHPGYKFSPSKAQTGVKKAARVDEEESERSELSDPEWIDNQKKYPTKPRPSMRRQMRMAGFPSNTIYGNDIGMNREGSNPSAYAFTNPGKIAPSTMDSVQHGQYYQTVVNPSMGNPNIENVMMRKAEIPGVQYSQAQPLGLPGGRYFGMFQEQAPTPYPDYPAHQIKLDPALMGYDNRYPVDGQLNRKGEFFDSQPTSGIGTPYSNIDSDAERADYMDQGRAGQSYHQMIPFNPGEQMLTDGCEWQNDLTHMVDFDQGLGDQHVNGTQHR